MEIRERIARTIAGLYNNARHQGMGMFQYQPGKMSKADAYRLADAALEDDRKEIYLDYVAGRVVKCRIRAVTEDVDFRLYDRDNGYGSGAQAVMDGLTDPAYSPPVG